MVEIHRRPLPRHGTDHDSKPLPSFGLEHRVLGQIDAIGVDEIQYAKGHKYLTLVYQIDLDVAAT